MTASSFSPQSGETIRALVVTAHPDPESATAATAAAVADGFRSGGFGEVIVHDILAAGFDPRYTAEDLAAYRGTRPTPPEDILAEQRMLEGFDAVALVFPVYWWGLPATLKGWIDRVFTRGWAYLDDPESGDSNEESTRGPHAPQRLYFFAIGAVSEASYRKHGYLDGMNAALVDGVAGFIGSSDSELVLLLDGEAQTPPPHREREARARASAAAIAARVTA